MSKLDKRDMPIYIIVLSLIFIFPLGIYYIVLKTKTHFKDLKKSAYLLNLCGCMGLCFVIVYFVINYSDYISMIDSHMSLDMYNFSFIYIYSYSLIFTISCLVGSMYLHKVCRNMTIYTEFINIRHIKDIDLIKEETGEDESTICDNINRLTTTDHLIHVKVSSNKIIFNKGEEKLLKDKFVKCKSCGNIMKLEKKNVRCDFCFRKLSIKDKI